MSESVLPMFSSRSFIVSGLMFNKDLEEINKSQYVMNNAINEIRNTPEATNSRIMEAEDRISEIEDRMVEINQRGNKKNELKETRTISETSRTI